MNLAGQLWELLITSAAEAFVQVGVFVGAVLLIFQYINYLQQGRLVGRIEKAAGWQPAIGALLGLTPGCGGAIFVMTLYVRGTVTFGTVVATLVATMGDAAFVLVAAAPLHFLYVSAASLVAAVLTGYAVDALGIGKGLRLRHAAALARRRGEELASAKAGGELADARAGEELADARAGEERRAREDQERARAAKESRRRLAEHLKVAHRAAVTAAKSVTAVAAVTDGEPEAGLTLPGANSLLHGGGAVSAEGEGGRSLAGGLVADSVQLHHIGHAEGDEIDIALHHRRGQDENSLAYRFTHRAFSAYWLLLAIGLVFGIGAVFGRDIGEALGKPGLTTIVGVVGTVFGILLTVAAHRFGINTSHEDEEHKLFSLRETLVHGAMDTAFVTSWVFVSFVVYHLGVLWLGRGDIAAGELIMAGWMQRTGLIAVVVGAFLGLIPGCGPQILFVTMFARGLLPFAALLANAISQDGDALFPLLVLDRRSALLATVVTTVPAILLGLLVYWLEVTTGLGAFLRP